MTTETEKREWADANDLDVEDYDLNHEAESGIRRRTLPDWALAKLVENVATVNKRCRKLGLEEFVLEVESLYTTVTISRDRFGKKREVWSYEGWADVAVIGHEVSLNGWTFAATIDWSLGEPLVRRHPTIEADLPLPANKVCDHCHTARSRKDTYLVIDENGEVKQVGRSCLKDYTGLTPAMVAWWASDDEFFNELGERPPSCFDPFETVLVSTVWTRLHGYLPKKKVEETDRGIPTSSIVWGVLSPSSKYEWANYNEVAAAITDDDYDAAAAAIEWAKGQRGSGEYGYSIAVAVSAEAITSRHIGIVASIPAAYFRAHNAAVERETAKAEAGPVPTGHAITIEGEVISAGWRDSDYGTQAKATVKLANGSRVWSTIPAKLLDPVLDEGHAPEWFIGKTIRFVADVDASREDPTFGFTRRPRKGVVVETLTV